ncbi:MAG: glycosyltransferase family 2 protein [Rhodospirillales bacterium]|nr:glycosyltransferase family 2 protein [Rhodospirillales bacterium]
MVSISVIVPVFNEQETVTTVLHNVRSVEIDGVSFEVIVIDDGSTDLTHERLSAEPLLYDRLITMERNGGKGAAVKAGLEQASGDYILFQDADLEYDPADYSKLLDPVKKFGADIVFGSRMIASPMTRVSYFWHKVGNRLITFIFNILNNTTFTDVYSCYLLYRRNLVDPASLKTMGWEQHAEILSLAVRNAKIIYEVPISYFGRSYGEGKKIRGHHALGVIWTILQKRLFN